MFINRCQIIHYIKKICSLFLFTIYEKIVKPNKKRKKKQLKNYNDIYQKNKKEIEKKKKKNKET